jgi:tetratricopeptide (TPR) repeat protein
MDYDRLRELQEKFEENPRRYFAPLANEYRKGGQPKRAIEICRSQLALMPGHMSGQIVYGQSLYECGEFDESCQVFERALTLDPENLIALRSLGDMSLQSGNTVQARKWYLRLLDADPKDTGVIALVSEIDASADAKPVPTPKEIPGIDADGGDQAIPFITDAEGVPVVAENATPAAPVVSETAPSAAFEPAPHSQPVEAEMPSEPVSAFEAAAASEPASAFEATAASEPASTLEAAAASAQASPPEEFSDATPPAGLERHYPVDPLEAGLLDDGTGAEGLHGGRQDEPMGAEGLLGSEPEVPPDPVGTEGLTGKAPPQALAGTTSSRTDDEDALDTWTPPPGANVHERKESEKEDRMFSGPGPEPFVNETMAQLYLQQGYRQLALRVYYQLAESRPDDKVLKDRIAEIEAADHAAHPESVAAAHREPTHAAARADSPPPSAHRESIEAPVHESPVREAPARETHIREAPARDAHIREAPARDAHVREAHVREARVREAPVHEAPVHAQRAEPESIAARQPSVREFFATLGRRRPPRSAGSPGGSARPGNSVPADTAAPLGSSAPSASLDSVFAGATVSPSDSRAAARLAGAFSGASGTSRATAPTPPMPTPRVNPRLPQMQESEEDVAKFRAWLDGLTGE